jgi:hypothetical protein
MAKHAPPAPKPQGNQSKKPDQTAGKFPANPPDTQAEHAALKAKVEANQKINTPHRGGKTQTEKLPARPDGSSTGEDYAGNTLPVPQTGDKK